MLPSGTVVTVIGSEQQSAQSAGLPAQAPALTGGRFALRGDVMQFDWQRGSCIVETDHPLSDREKGRIEAELQAIGLRAVILPAGVTLSHVAVQGLEDEGE